MLYSSVGKGYFFVIINKIWSTKPALLTSCSYRATREGGADASR